MFRSAGKDWNGLEKVRRVLTGLGIVGKGLESVLKCWKLLEWFGKG